MVRHELLGDILGSLYLYLFWSNDRNCNHLEARMKPSERIVQIEQSLMSKDIVSTQDALAIFRCAVMKYLDEQAEKEKS